MVFPKEKNGKKILDSLSWEEFFKETKNLKHFLKKLAYLID